MQVKILGDLLNPSEALPLAAINDLTPEGKTVLSSAKQILAALGKKDADVITVEDTADTTKILAAQAPNGDGVVTLRATQDPETQALIKDILATTGAVPDRAGGEGVTAEKVEAFFKEVEAYLKWLDATAATTAKSAAGSVTVMPPATLTNTSSVEKFRPARLSRTASRSDRRF